MDVSDVMVTDVVSVAPDATLREAFTTMSRAHVRHLPVVRGRTLAGIITDRDFRLYGMSLTGVEEGELRFSVDDTLVRDVMNAEPVTAAPDVDLREAVDLFVDEKVGALPVVDDEDHLVGIVSYIDLLVVLQDYLSD